MNLAKQQAEQKVLSAVVETIATLIGAKVLVLEAIEASTNPRPEFEDMADGIEALSQEVETMMYALQADVMMTATFGKDGDLRKDAYKRLAKMVKDELKESRHQ